MRAGLVVVVLPILPSRREYSQIAIDVALATLQLVYVCSPATKLKLFVAHFPPLIYYYGFIIGPSEWTKYEQL